VARGVDTGNWVPIAIEKLLLSKMSPTGERERGGVALLYTHTHIHRERERERCLARNVDVLATQ
jgi:hypothetical protein